MPKSQSNNPSAATPDQAHPFRDHFFSHRSEADSTNLIFGQIRYDDRSILDQAVAQNLKAHVYFRLLDLGFSHEDFIIKPRVGSSDDRMEYLGMGAEASVYHRTDLGRADKIPAALRSVTSVSMSGGGKPDVVNTHFDSLIRQVCKAIEIRAAAKLLKIESQNPYVTPDGVYHEQLLPPDGKPINTSQILSAIKAFHGVRNLRLGQEFFTFDQMNPSGHVLQYDGDSKRMILIDGVHPHFADLSAAKSEAQRVVFERLNTDVERTVASSLNQVMRFLTPLPKR